MAILGERFLHTAHEVKTARKAFLRLASFFENERQFPELAALVKDIRKTNGQEAIILTNGGSCEFIARSKGSGRGFTVDVLVCDEAQDLADEELAALLPTISASPSGNPQVVLTGTPPQVGRGLPFRRVRADGEAQRDARLAWTDFGPPDGPLPDVDDREAWVAHNPAEGIRISLAEMERERKLMSAEMFAAERLGYWGDPNADQEDTLFGDSWGDCAAPGEAPSPNSIGVAVSIDRAWSSIGGANVDGDQPIVFNIQRTRGTSWVVARAIELATEHDCPIVVDGHGPAADLVDDLQEAAPSRVIVTSTSDVMDACASFLDAVVETHALAHLDQPDLNEAADAAVPRQVGDRFAWGRKQSAGDISALEAATLALWGAGQDFNTDAWGFFS